jgi:hypothetical protein
MKVFLQLDCVLFFFCNPTEFRRPSLEVKMFVLLPVSLSADRCQGSADLPLFAENMDLTNHDWGREETFKLTFSVYSNLV